jgi:hypothetical protein
MIHLLCFIILSQYYITLLLFPLFSTCITKELNFWTAKSGDIKGKGCVVGLVIVKKIRNIELINFTIIGKSSTNKSREFDGFILTPPERGY